MKKLLRSIDELMGCCTTSSFTNYLPHFLSLKRSENWELLSGFASDKECHAEFIARPADGEIPTRIVWRCSSRGEYGHIELLLSA